MKIEMIDRYLDECGITPGKWEYDDYGCAVYGKSIGGCRMEMSTHKIADIRGWGHLQYHGEEKAVRIQKANQKVIAAAPKMLVALISNNLVFEVMACEENDPCAEIIFNENNRVIESALPGRTWPEIKARLEEIEEEEK